MFPVFSIRGIFSFSFFALASLPTFSQVTLFYQGFDTVWTTPASLPGWTGTSAPSNNIWHKNNYTTGWTSGGSGAYTPGGASGTSNSARFHSYSSANGSTGNIITPAIDLSGYSNNKRLSFYYINKGSGSDELDVFISSDGGVTWSSSLLKLRLSSSWTRYYIPLGRLSSPAVRIMFQATSDFGSTDIGVDEVTLKDYIQDYTTIPYYQNFEMSWVNGNTVRDVPDKYWFNCPATGDISWRVQNDGSSAGWSASASGTVTPSGGSYAADFHSYSAYPGHFGYLDLFVDLNQAGNKQLSFNYKNDSPSDELQVLFSTDGGVTFSSLVTLSTGNWTNQNISLGNPIASYAVIRFHATSDQGFDDIGIDDLSIINLGPLNIGFTFFNAVPEGGKVRLRWKIKPAGNILKFIIEKSISEKNFERLLEIPAAFTDHQAEDIDVVGGMLYYYRIRAIFEDDTVSSEIKAVFTGPPELQVIAHPRYEGIKVTMPFPDEAFRLSIINANGQIVYNAFLSGKRIQVLRPDLGSGLYIIVLENPYHSFRKKFIIPR